MRQAGSSKTVDPTALAQSLSKIRVQNSQINSENRRESTKKSEASNGESAQLRNVKESLESKRFDVFLSFAEEDKEFAEEVRHRIISKCKLKVFLPSEG